MLGIAAPAIHAAAPALAAMLNPAAAPVQLNASVTPVPQSLQQLPALHLTTYTGQAAAINTRSQPVWASFADGSGNFGAPAADSRLLGVTLDPTIATNNPNPLPIVVYGFTTSPTDATDVAAYVARFSLDGTMVSSATLNLGTGTHLEIHSAVVDPNDSSIYVAGAATLNGQTSDFLDHISADLTTEVWSAPLGHPVLNEGHTNGVFVDKTGTNLYVTGDLDGNVFVAKLTSLSSSTPTDLLDFSYPFTDANGNAVPSVGNAVAVDSQGNVDLATTFTAGSDALPGVLQVDPTLMVSAGGSWQGSPILVGSSGPNGTMNSIYVDSTDNIFVTGGVSDPNTAAVDDVFVGSFDSTGNTRIPGSAGVFVAFSDNTTGAAVQTIGYGIQTDALGNIFFGVGNQDPSTNNAGNMFFLSLDPTFNNFVNAPGSDPGDGTAFGSNDDQVHGMVLDPTDNVLFLVGFTNSPDFNFTTGEAQAKFGAGPYDGVVVAYALP